MREKKDFRDMLERINERFPDKEMLNITEVSDFIGRDRRIVAKTWEKEFSKLGSSKYMTKVTLARLMCP